MNLFNDFLQDVEYKLKIKPVSEVTAEVYDRKVAFNRSLVLKRRNIPVILGFSLLKIKSITYTSHFKSSKQPFFCAV